MATPIKNPSPIDVSLNIHFFRQLCVIGIGLLLTQLGWARTILTSKDAPAAVIVLPDNAQPIARYAAKELVWHVERATGVRLTVHNESEARDLDRVKIYVGDTKAAVSAGVDVDALPKEGCVIKSIGDALFIAGKDGPGEPLSTGHSYSGTLWGAYEFLETQLGVTWLWPGELGTRIPKRESLVIEDLDETIKPHYIQRQLRPGLGPTGFTTADQRLAFSQTARDKYARDQNVYLRRHRMGRSPETYFSERRFGSGHAFHGWWEKHGADHPEWFHLLPNGTRGPADPNRPDKFSMCVSNPELHQKVVELWNEERKRDPRRALGLGVGENDGSAHCQCESCLSWDGPGFDPAELPAGLERSYEPVQAGTRYAKMTKAVYDLAAGIDPQVRVHTYAYLNYFWSPVEELQLNRNVVIGFVPWFRWAGWFPRPQAEQEWIKQHWLGWQKTGASVYYRPNWFLDGYAMPHVFMHQFADAFQFYHRHGMIGTDFDSLQGMWAAQGPNLYLLARLHVRPDRSVEKLLDEYYAVFGPAESAVRKYFDYWEQYSIENSPRSAKAIQSRRGGHFRRYAHYATVADELYPLDVFPRAFKILEEAQQACETNPSKTYATRIEFLREGLEHSRQCILAARVMNDSQSTATERGEALQKLATYRRSVEETGIANMDRAAIIETDSWKDVAGFRADW